MKYYVWVIGLLLLTCCLGSRLWAESLPTPSSAPLNSGSASSFVNLAGTETRLLPANYDIWSCDWDPTGKALVFAGKMQGDDAVKMRIWYWPLDPVSAPILLTNTDQLIDSAPRWSPDGAKVIMTRRSYGKTPGSNGINSALWVKQISDGAGKQVTFGPEDKDPFWSPDGGQVVFSRGLGPYQAKLMVLNLTDNSVNVLAGAEGELFNSPWWGRNGLIYFTKFTPVSKTTVVADQSYQVMDFGKGSIWAYNPADKTTTPVVVDDYDNRLPAISPDGTKMAFVSNRQLNLEGNGKFDRGSLFIKDLKTGEILFVTNKVGLNGGSLTWSPDGKKIAFFTFRSIRPSIWVINLP